MSTRSQTAVLTALALVVALLAVSIWTAPLWSPPTSSQYSESLVRLPGFDPLYGYVEGGNCVPAKQGGCFGGGRNYSQVPVLSSWGGEPLGIYYVNNASELVEYGLTNQSLRVVASVTLLYQTYAGYGGMIANEFFLPYGYDEALFFGTVTPTASTLAVETVNLTSGLVSMVRTDISIAATNQQATMVGANLIAVISAMRNDAGCNSDCPANVVMVNMTTGMSWTAAHLPFFEANNLYWLPQERQLLDIEAQGSSFDRLEQWNETNASGYLQFSLTATVEFDSGVLVNWVNGIGYNPALHEIAFSAGSNQSGSWTYVLHYAADGLVTRDSMTRYDLNTNQSNSSRLFMGQQYVYTSDWVMGGFFDGTQYLFDPWTGSVRTANEPFTDLPLVGVCDAGCFLGTYGPSPGYRIDFHASIAINDPFWSVMLAIAPVFLP